MSERCFLCGKEAGFKKSAVIESGGKFATDYIVVNCHNDLCVPEYRIVNTDLTKIKINNTGEEGKKRIMEHFKSQYSPDKSTPILNKDIINKLG
jgi:hypothetical protein